MKTNILLFILVLGLILPTLLTSLFFLISPLRIADYLKPPQRTARPPRWIWVYLVFALVNTLKILLPPPLWLSCAATLLISPFLFLVYTRETKQRSAPAALFYLFSFCGDMASNFEGYGMGPLAILVTGYMLAHICSAWINFSFIKSLNLSLYLLGNGILLIYAAAIIPALHLDSSNYIASSVVLIYIFCLLANHISASQIHLNEKMMYYPLGTKLYIASDTLIALAHFPLADAVKVIPYSPLIKVLIWISYASAIGLFTWGLITLTQRGAKNSA